MLRHQLVQFNIHVGTRLVVQPAQASSTPNARCRAAFVFTSLCGELGELPEVLDASLLKEGAATGETWEQSEEIELDVAIGCRLCHPLRIAQNCYTRLVRETASHADDLIQSQFDLFPHDEPPTRSRQRRLYTTKEVRDLQAALEPFIDLKELRRVGAHTPAELHTALRMDKPPLEVRVLLDTLAAVLLPVGRDKIRSPQDAAALLMLQMGHLDQEEMRTMLLDTRNKVISIVTVYRGTVNTSQVRVGEVYKEAVRRNATSLILAHNHPSGEPDPSPEDVLVTRKIVEAGELLEVECLDHLVIGQGKYVSMRERRLGFSRK
jgi:DNA repair protein RadC